MTTPPNRLRAEIVLIVAVKLVLLVILWRLFVHDQHVDADAPATAAHFSATTARPPSSGEAHAQ